MQRENELKTNTLRARQSPAPRTKHHQKGVGRWHRNGCFTTEQAAQWQVYLVPKGQKKLLYCRSKINRRNDIDTLKSLLAMPAAIFCQKIVYIKKM